MPGAIVIVAIIAGAPTTAITRSKSARRRSQRSGVDGGGGAGCTCLRDQAHTPMTESAVTPMPLPVTVSRINTRFESEIGDCTLVGWVY